MRVRDIAFAAFGLFMIAAAGVLAAWVGMWVAGRAGGETGFWGYLAGGMAASAAALILAERRPR